MEVAKAAAADRSVGAVELVSVDSMAVYRGMDIGTDKPGPAARRLVPHHLIDMVDPAEDFSVRAFQREAGDRSLRHRRSRASPVARRRDRALPPVWSTMDCNFRAASRRWPPSWWPSSTPPAHRGARTAADRSVRCTGGWPRWTRWPPAAWSRATSAGSSAPSRSALGSGRPFSSFGPGLERYPATPVHLVGIRPDLGRPRRAHPERFVRLMDGGFLDEVRGLAGRPGGLSRTARQALGYRELLAHVEGGVTLPEARGRGRAAHPRLRPPTDGMVPPRPPYRVGRPGEPDRCAGCSSTCAGATQAGMGDWASR